MRVPKGIMRVCDVAATESTRCSFQGVLVNRESPSKCRATATDGRRLITVTWSEDDKVLPKPFEDAAAAKDGFSAIIPSNLARRFDEFIGASSRTYAKYPFVIVDENQNGGTCRLVTPDPNCSQQIDGHVVEGQFPPFADVIPDFEIVTRGSSGGKQQAARIEFRASQLIGMLNALMEVVPDAPDDRVTIEVPLSPSRPFKLERRQIEDSRSAIGVMMPLNPA